MLFSVVIPTYNRAPILRDTLLSVIEQSFGDFEIVVVDDGSTDNTGETVDQIADSRIRYFYKTNEERSIARNFGAEKATGKYLIFLDSDDKMSSGHLASAAAFIQKYLERPQFIFSGYKIINPDQSTLYEFGIDGFFRKEKLFYGNFLGCSAVIIDRGLFKKHFFNTDKRMILFEDWELWLRIIAENQLYCYAGKSILMLNHDKRSVLNYSVCQIDEKINFFRDHILKTSSVIRASFFHRRAFLMGIYSYAALHIALTGKDRSTAFGYFLRAFFNDPLFIFKRRFFGILKHLL